jgi:endonuclease-3 related protein
VQNTSWANTARAIVNIRSRDLMRPDALLDLEPGRLEDLLQPAGCFRQKARSVAIFCHWWLATVQSFQAPEPDTAALRSELLSLHGIGPETADCMLLYAFGRPVFVVDSYTRRLLSRLGLAQVPAGRPAYESLRAHVENLTGPQPEYLGELHALIVEHGKQVCRARPRCELCQLRTQCPH